MPADERARQQQERQLQVRTPSVADGQSAEAIDTRYAWAVDHCAHRDEPSPSGRGAGKNNDPYGLEMSHAGVRSTTLQCCPSRSLKSMPRRTMPRRWQVVRQRVKSYPLSARNFLGHWRGRPVRRVAGGAAG